MADRVLFIGFGQPVRGREERALEVFNESVGLYGRLQQDGRIEAFDVMLMAPSSVLGGCFVLHGSREQLSDVREDADFVRTITDATLICDDINVIDGYTNAGIADQMTIWQEALQKVPQPAH